MPKSAQPSTKGGLFLKSQSAAILESGFGESLLANASRRAIASACSSRESFAKRICSSRVERSSGRIRSTSVFVVAASISLQSRWTRSSVSRGTYVCYRTSSDTAIQQNPDLGSSRQRSRHPKRRRLSIPAGRRTIRKLTVVVGRLHPLTPASFEKRF
jgi:hypothetical protein